MAALFDGQEHTVAVEVEAFGEMRWMNPTGDQRWDESVPCARVKDADGRRYFITPSKCFRNGTVLRPSIIGEHGTIGVYRGEAIWFNCPTLFKGDVRHAPEVPSLP